MALDTPLLRRKRGGFKYPLPLTSALAWSSHVPIELIMLIDARLPQQQQKQQHHNAIRMGSSTMTLWTQSNAISHMWTTCRNALFQRSGPLAAGRIYVAFKLQCVVVVDFTACDMNTEVTTQRECHPGGFVYNMMATWHRTNHNANYTTNWCIIRVPFQSFANCGPPYQKIITARSRRRYARFDSAT